MSSGAHRSEHRANYTLELGLWHARCRSCGYLVSDPLRRRAAAIYRHHIKETNGLGPFVIDLEEAQGEFDADPAPESAVG